jgi:uncharacterized phiE125 gp8 family phage protein
MSTELKTPPARTLISLADALNWLKIESGDDDDTVERCIDIVHDEAETILGRAIESQVWLEYFDHFPGYEFKLTRGKVISVESIKYLDSDAVEQTWDTSNYEVDLKSIAGRIRPLPTKSFPSTATRYNAVTVEYTCGFPNMPKDILSGMYRHLTDVYDNRETLLHTKQKVVSVPRSVYWSYHRHRLNLV